MYNNMKDYLKVKRLGIRERRRQIFEIIKKQEAAGRK